MPRNISFSLTTPQFLDGTKDVTRRLGWERVRAGDVLRAVEKCMGLKKGEKIKPLGLIHVTSVGREPLRRILDDLEYGFSETLREGFPLGHTLHWPSEFVDWFCKGHTGCFPEREITRIEFERIDACSVSLQQGKTP